MKLILLFSLVYSSDFFVLFFSSFFLFNYIKSCVLFIIMLK